MRHFISLIENINAENYTVPQDVIDAIGETLDNGSAWSLENVYSLMDELDVPEDATTEVLKRLLPNIKNWLDLMINEYTLVGAMDSIMYLIDEEGLEEFKPILIQTIKQNRSKVIKGLLRNLQESVMGIEHVIDYLMSLGFEWTELQTIYDSVHTGRN